MPLVIRDMPSLIVTSGTTASNAIRQFDDAWAMTIYPVSATFTSTTVNLAVEHSDTGTAFVVLQSGGADVLVTSGRAMVLSPAPFRQIRIETGAAEAATLTFRVTKTILT